jgi:hypothetical protein
VNFPLRMILTLVVLVAIAAIGVAGLISVVRATSMTAAQRGLVAGGIIILMAVLATWVIFLWPVYWD